MSNLIKIYDYTDEDGNLLYQNCRFEQKAFRSRRPDGNGDYIWDIKGVERTLYRLPEVIQASSQDFLSIVEGEADADRLYEIGFAATTSGSATSWKPEFAKYFKGKLVCIIPDNDKAGRDYMKGVTDSLYGVATEIRVIELPNLRESEDVSNWLDNGGTREELIEIIDSTGPFKPAIEKSDIKLNLKSMAEVKAERIEWFWPNKIPDSSLTIISGDPGATKSYLTQYMAAHITTGTPWPDCPDVPVKKGSVIFIADEASEWLKEKLQNGARLSSTLFEEGKEDGFGKDLLYRAKKKLGVKANKEGFGGQWFWQLREE